MQILLSGISGFGKTAHALDMLFWQNNEFTNLDKYVEGISKLDIVRCPHYEFPKLSTLRSPDFVPLSTVDDDGEDEEGGDSDADKYKPWLPSHPEYQAYKTALHEAKHPIELWYLWATKGSILVIDEAQRFFRPRPSGSKVPLYVSMLEYHRHFGIHFLFITQAPRLMDLHVRMNTEKHIHIDKTWFRGVIYEWSGCRSMDDGKPSALDKKDAAKSKYSPPKHVFPFYKSASLHLETKHKKPLAFYILLAAVPLFLAVLFFTVNFIRGHQKEKEQAAKSQQQNSGFITTASGVVSAGVVSGGATQGQRHDYASLEEYDKFFTPIVPARPETAPAFSDLRKVVNMPQISACLQTSVKCKCYTQQGSPILDMNDTNCRVYLAGGTHFDPYRQSFQPVAMQSKQAIPLSKFPPVPSEMMPDRVLPVVQTDAASAVQSDAVMRQHFGRQGGGFGSSPMM